LFGWIDERLGIEEWRAGGPDSQASVLFQAPRIAAAGGHSRARDVAAADGAIDLHAGDGNWQVVGGGDERDRLAGHFDLHFGAANGAAQAIALLFQVEQLDSDFLAA
jgi:hypothetical protein